MHVNLLPNMIWGNASKIKPIRARLVSDLITDAGILSHLQLVTLEGTQTINPRNYICEGEDGEMWQQDAQRLLAKYTPVSIDPRGWLICKPLATHTVKYLQIHPDMLGGNTWFQIHAKWGEQEGDKFVQYGKPYDYVCQDMADPTDVWVVAERLFESTYQVEEV